MFLFCLPAHSQTSIVSGSLLTFQTVRHVVNPLPIKAAILCQNGCSLQAVKSRSYAKRIVTEY